MNLLRLEATESVKKNPRPTQGNENQAKISTYKLGKVWEERFAKETGRVTIALKYQDTAVVLSILFSRLYVLRNQLLHGSATWQSRVNRSQVEDGARVLAALLPVIVDIMMANHEHDWGSVHYPVVD